MNKKLILIISIALFSCFNNVFAASDYTFDPKHQSHSLYVPEGKGPFPAILMLHASTGVQNVNHDWAARLKDHGYVVYVIDSFKPRGWVNRSSVGWDMATNAQLADVTPAYRYLSHLPNVDPSHIGLLGFSMGGFDVLRVMATPKFIPEEFQMIPFMAAASFYGVCHRLSPETRLKGPTSIFIGSDDDRATTEDCKQLVKHSGGDHKSITMHVYQNALHGFDNFEFPPSKDVIDERGEQYHIGYNEQARQASLVDLPKFFDRYLK